MTSDWPVDLLGFPLLDGIVIQWKAWANEGAQLLSLSLIGSQIPCLPVAINIQANMGWG